MSPSPTTSRPTAKQLAYLKALAERTATTFTYPHTSTQASREIDRLKQLQPLNADERALARRALDGDRERHTYATQPDEIAAHRSTTTWR
jgi:DUF3072 family protein